MNSAGLRFLTALGLASNARPRCIVFMNDARGWYQLAWVPVTAFLRWIAYTCVISGR
jgi:hypothetical protein